MPRANQRVISLPKDLVDRVEAWVYTNPKRYPSIAKFLGEAAVEKLNRDQEHRATMWVPEEAFDRWETAIKKHPEYGFKNVDELMEDAILWFLDAMVSGRITRSPELTMVSKSRSQIEAEGSFSRKRSRTAKPP